jgi:histidyl-tRNA synthetase
VPDLFVAYLGEAALKRAISVARVLRREGRICYVDFRAGSLKSQMRLADKIKAQHVLIIGDDELSRGRYTLKQLKDSKQWDVSLDELVQHLQSVRPGGL